MGFSKSILVGGASVRQATFTRQHCTADDADDGAGGGANVTTSAKFAITTGAYRIEDAVSLMYNEPLIIKSEFRLV